jgi:hypothetical protein
MNEYQLYLDEYKNNFLAGNSKFNSSNLYGGYNNDEYYNGGYPYSLKKYFNELKKEWIPKVIIPKTKLLSSVIFKLNKRLSYGAYKWLTSEQGKRIIYGLISASINGALESVSNIIQEGKYDKESLIKAILDGSKTGIKQASDVAINELDYTIKDPQIKEHAKEAIKKTEELIRNNELSITPFKNISGGNNYDNLINNYLSISGGSKNINPISLNEFNGGFSFLDLFTSNDSSKSKIKNIYKNIKEKWLYKIIISKDSLIQIITKKIANKGYTWITSPQAQHILTGIVTALLNGALDGISNIIKEGKYDKQSLIKAILEGSKTAGLDSINVAKKEIERTITDEKLKEQANKTMELIGQSIKNNDLTILKDKQSIPPLPQDVEKEIKELPFSQQQENKKVSFSTNISSIPSRPPPPSYRQSSPPLLPPRPSSPSSQQSSPPPLPPRPSSPSSQQSSPPPLPPRPSSPSSQQSSPPPLPPRPSSPSSQQSSQQSSPPSLPPRSSIPSPPPPPSSQQSSIPTPLPPPSSYSKPSVYPLQKRLEEQQKRLKSPQQEEKPQSSQSELFGKIKQRRAAIESSAIDCSQYNEDKEQCKLIKDCEWNDNFESCDNIMSGGLSSRRRSRKSARRSSRKSGRRNSRKSGRRSNRKSARRSGKRSSSKRSSRKSARRSSRKSARKSGRRSSRKSSRINSRRNSRKSSRRSGKRSSKKKIKLRSTKINGKKINNISMLNYYN